MTLRMATPSATVLGPGRPLPILMYHSIPADGGACRGPSDVPLDRLRRHLHLLLDEGWSILGLSAAVAARESHSSRRIVALSFDDAYADNLPALELAAGLGAGATLNVPTAFIGPPATDRTADRLTWSQLRDLNAQGVELGSHSVSHRPLDTLGEDELGRELTDSKQALFDEVGVEPVSICYPHGYTSRRVSKTAIGLGYANGCTVGRRVARAGDPLIALPRLQPTVAQTDAEFLSLLDHGEPGLGVQLKRIAQPAWRLARRGAALLGKDLT